MKKERSGLRRRLTLPRRIIDRRLLMTRRAILIQRTFSSENGNVEFHART